MSSHPAPTFCRQIGHLCEEYPVSPKVLLVNRVQHGQAILEAVARQHGGWVGLEAKTPLQLAESLTEGCLQPQEKSLPEGLGPALARESFRRLPAGKRETLGGEGGHALSAPLARTFEELRLQGVGAAMYQDFQEEASLRKQAKAEAYAEYERLLKEEGYVDTAAIFRHATEQVRGRGQPPGQVFAVLDLVELPALAQKLLRALREEVESSDEGAFFRVGEPGPSGDRSGFPSRAAAKLFEDAPTPGKPNWQSPPLKDRWIKERWEETPQGEKPVTFWTSVGAESEAEAVFRDILQSGAPYDEAEIAYADPDPYRTVVETVAERHDVPITLSAGRPVGATSAGQSLRGFLEWISGGFEAETLVRLLRGRLLRLGRTLDEDKELRASRAATLLAEQRYGAGPQAYFDALRRKQKQKEKSRAASGGSSRLDKEVREIEALRSAIRDLMKLVPRTEVSLAEMARSAEEFLEVFGPVDKPPKDLPQDKRSPAQAARGRIIETLEELGGSPVLGDLPRKQATKQLRRLVDQMYARASAPKPGHVHVVPLEAAGYAGRRKLYTIGLDGESTSATVAEDPLLTDRERRRLEEKTEHPLRQAQAAGDRKSWLIGRGLRRHTGPLVLSARTFDLTEAEEVAPSPLYLRLREQWLSRQTQDGQGKQKGQVKQQTENDAPEVMEDLSDRHVTLLATPEPPLLGGGRAWRAAETARRRKMAGSFEGESAGKPGFPKVEGGIAEAFSWISDGRRAERKRRSEEYTAFDGMLSGEEHPNLDVLDSSYGEALSASRLEMLAASPYAYFLKYVLGARPLEEPALDDVLWIDRRKQGTILHDTFQAFMESLHDRGETPTPEHEPELIEELGRQIEAVRDQIEPPSEAVAKAMKSRLAEDARVFLRSEARAESQPHKFELGFGFGDSPYRDSDHGPATIDLGNGVEFELRGQIDRIDRAGSGELVLWDYKTGSKGPYEGDEAPLQKGEMLQWALYAYAAEDLLGTGVRSSGYFFTSTKGLGERIEHDPGRYREDIAELLSRLSKISRSGCFPMNLSSTPWMFGDYDQVVPDIETREDEFGQKTYPEDRPTPPHLDD